VAIAATPFRWGPGGWSGNMLLCSSLAQLPIRREADTEQSIIMTSTFSVL